MSEARPLPAFQRDFAAALFGAADAASARSLADQPGFAVYRNTVMLACIEALAANYPTVQQLVGDAWFRDAAQRFVPAHLPTDGALASYGGGFAGFLAGFEPARELPYLPGVAALDRGWTEAHLSADASVLDVNTLTALAPEALAEAVLVPHPSVRTFAFEAMPVFTIWRRHREALAIGDELAWHGESALVVRPRDAVHWHRIEPEAAAFMAACARGARFAEAADAAPGFERSLPALIAAGAFTRVAFTRAELAAAP